VFLSTTNFTPPPPVPMSISEKLKDTVAHIKRGRKGSRFIEFYEYRKKREGDSIGKTIAMIALGFFLIIIGLIGVMLPILPGFLFFIPGIAILVARSRLLAKGLDRVETIIGNAFRKP
jgi:hypothetical protein